MPKIVTYDLRAPKRDYLFLYDALKKYSYAKPTESCYVLETSETCEQIRDYLLNYIDADDRLFVAELTGVAAWYKVYCGDDDLKKRL
jgi:hypothetical protein